MWRILADERIGRRYLTTPKQQANTAGWQQKRVLRSGEQGSHVINSHLARKPPTIQTHKYLPMRGWCRVHVLISERTWVPLHSPGMCVRALASRVCRLFLLCFCVVILFCFCSCCFCYLARYCGFACLSHTTALLALPRSRLLGAQLCFFSFSTRHTQHHCISAARQNLATVASVCSYAKFVWLRARKLMCVRVCIALVCSVDCIAVMCASRLLRRDCHAAVASFVIATDHATMCTLCCPATLHGAALYAALSQCYNWFLYAPSPSLFYGI